MPRTLKKTKIKWLPPKVQLRNNDSVVGSVPSYSNAAQSVTASLAYDDLKTILFQSQVLTAGTGVAMPSGLPTNNESLYRVDQDGTTVLDEELNTNITVTGVVRKGVGDSFLSFVQPQTFTPFRDDSNPAVDGLSMGNSFYATGSKISDVGEGFDQPLWSKDKIEIDLTPSVSHSFYIENYTSSSNNFPMAYWNKDRKVWEGVGAGIEFGNYSKGRAQDTSQICEEQCIGFGSGINNGGVGTQTVGAGAVISNFGFPYHVKYHGTSSNTVAMSDYISSPFLLEKIVLEWSGSLAFNNTLYGGYTAYTVCTFFILNQRSPFRYNDPAAQSFVYRIPAGDTATLTLGATIPSSYDSGPERNTIRDLVTYAQIVGFTKFTDAATITAVSRERNIYSGNPELTSLFGSWSGRFIMSGTVKNALPNDGLGQIQIGDFAYAGAAFITINKNSARSGLFTPGGRDFVGSFSKGKELQSSEVLTPRMAGQPSGRIIVLDKQSKVNPYLLQPTDKLIFGWQLPVANMINAASDIPQYDGKGTELLFASVPSKITFFGSYIKGGEESHESLNQVIASMAVHKEIG
jgi:hypothetical protein